MIHVDNAPLIHSIRWPLFASFGPSPGSGPCYHSNKTLLQLLWHSKIDLSKVLTNKHLFGDVCATNDEVMFTGNVQWHLQGQKLRCHCCMQRCLKEATRSTCPRDCWLTTIPTPRHTACYRVLIYISNANSPLLNSIDPRIPYSTLAD